MNLIKKCLAPFALLFGLSLVAQAQTDLITIEIDNPGPNTEITLSSDGHVFVDLPWPVSNQEFDIPEWLIPEGATPYEGETIVIPYKDEEGETYPDEVLGLAAGLVLGGYLVGEWLSELGSDGGQEDATYGGGGSTATATLSYRIQIYPGRFNPKQIFYDTMLQTIIDEVEPYTP